MLSCWWIPHDAVGWARRNIPVFTSRPMGPVCWAARLDPPCVRLVGKEGQAEGEVCVGVPFPFGDANRLQGRGECGPHLGYVRGIGSVRPSG